jgi:hypothetical protein
MGGNWATHDLILEVIAGLLCGLYAGFSCELYAGSMQRNGRYQTESRRETGNPTARKAGND